MNIIEYLTEMAFTGYNNSFDMRNKFYNDLILNLKRESNKINFLKKLEKSVENYYLEHQLECEEENCNFIERRNITNNIINSIKMDIEKEENTKNTSSNFNINGGIINGHVGTNISGEYNYFSSVESACKEANLSIEEIAKIKSLFENKDKHGLITFFQGMASETLGVILGYLTLGQFGFFKQH